jgi:hypothetical protein
MNFITIAALEAIIFRIHMKDSPKMYFIALALILVGSSCKKSPDVVLVPIPPVEKPVPVPPKDSTSTPSNAKILNLGTGSGNLVIDGKSLNLTSPTIIKIKGGAYADIQISNISNDNFTTTIQNDGLVELNGNVQMRISNVKNVIISGSGTQGIDKGFIFKNRTTDGASIQLNGDLNNFTLKYISFSNLNTYGVIQYNSQKIFDGSANSYSNNLKFLNLDCDNTGTLIRFRGSAESNVVSGLMKNVEIAYINYKNSRTVGSVVVIENADSYDIHNNKVQNINQDNSNHNGVFYLQGNGKFYNNYVKDHQGNAIRAWAYSIGTTPKDILIFNNIVANSREYSAFEIQSFDRNMISGKTTYCNAQVFNNTCGNLLPKYGTFPAQVLDLYNLYGGTCTIYNNLTYQLTLVGNNNTNYFWNELSSTKGSGTNNKYFKTYQDAGIENDQTFYLTSNSSAKKSGTSLSGKSSSSSLAAATNNAVNFDYYGKARSLTSPSIGAVE